MVPPAASRPTPGPTIPSTTSGSQWRPAARHWPHRWGSSRLGPGSAGDIPLILKLNGHDMLGNEDEPTQDLYGSVDDALRLGCVGVGYTIYPGSARRFEMYERLRDIVREAKARGLFVLVWSYPRGGGLSKEGETAIDVVAYAAHVAAELGAHVIKVKIPSPHLEGPEAKKVYEERRIPIGTLVERVRHVVQAAFAGRRIVIFSGGATKANDEDVLAEIAAVRDGGGFGTIMGRVCRSLTTENWTSVWRDSSYKRKGTTRSSCGPGGQRRAGAASGIWSSRKRRSSPTSPGMTRPERPPFWPTTRRSAAPCWTWD
jgi:DhnA family fructose-bisphosphate aldolase class Ia